jgi:DNA-binding PadR family transcriptional regulator
MYADNTLTPKEATRLCALGMLAESDRSYAELASGVRHFVTHVMGPSLDVLGTSVELLKHEGLIDTVDGDGDDALLRINDDGMQELRTLLMSNLKAAENDLNKLVIALKFRFMEVLSAGQKNKQMDLMIHGVENELARLEELRAHHAHEGGHLIEWLDREIEDLAFRRNWLVAKQGSL